MSRVTTLKGVKKLLLPGVFAAAVATLIGFQSTGIAAEGSSRTWSIVAHFEYQNGFQYDYVVARGVPTDVMPSMLAECGAGHWTGSVVRFHCFPIPE